jgi:hypothetical protein
MEPLSTAKPDPEGGKANATSRGTAPAISNESPLADTTSGIGATRQRSALEESADESQETDIWWGSYAGRTMTPSFIVCGLLTALIIWLVWLIWPKQENLPHLERYTTYILVGAVWIFQMIRWCFRIVAINYRLTTRRLICQRGFQSAATKSIELAGIATVRIERAALESHLKVATLRIVPIDTSQPSLILEGIVQPNRIASLIMNQVQEARSSGC